MQNNVKPELVGKRYWLRDLMGEGGMGTVYRATDRLTGQEIALKRLKIDKADILLGSNTGAESRALALANEFGLLASLHHPNLVGVLDYGFETNRQPFFTMSLIEQRQTIVEKGSNLTLAEKIALLIQALQGLAYVHRRGIVHRDLKPANILCDAEGTVKVLDFGLSIKAESTQVTGASGTLAYMPPEALNEKAISVPGDLYAIGMIAYELFFGGFPFDTQSNNRLIEDVLHTIPDVHGKGLSTALEQILLRLLAKTPEERYQTAEEVIGAFGDAVGKPFAVETKATRESYLQAAKLIGRDTELRRITEKMRASAQGQGSVWLLGGESGVGKSRLVDELRTRALVDGTLVLRGQAIGEGASAYQVWREVLRWLCLVIDLDQLQLSVLKEIVPDLELLLERQAPAAPRLEPQSAQARLLSVIESVFRANIQPTLVILEDLQWAGPESLVLLNRLSQVVPELPLFILGTYRSEERPDLPKAVSGAQTIALRRLEPDQLGELARAMLGRTLQPNLVDYLQRETEGNVYFLVEVVRALAEASGELDKVGDVLSEIQPSGDVLSVGIQQVLLRRLRHVPVEDFGLLQLAAVMGRQLDPLLLQALAPDASIDRWLNAVSDAVVIETQDNRWRFTHDKLRESLLNSLPPGSLPALHRQIAEAIEKVYPDRSDLAPTLAYHWQQAGDRAKEVHYESIAGAQALQNGAYQRAIDLLERALSLSNSGQLTEADRALMERQLAEAYFGLGNMAQARSHLEAAARLVERPVPPTPFGKMMGMMRETTRQLGHRTHLLNRAQRPDEQRQKFLIASQVYERLANVYYFDNAIIPIAYASVRALNLAERYGPSPEFVRAAANVGLSFGFIPVPFLANTYDHLAQRIGTLVDNLYALSWAEELRGMYQAGRGDWQGAEDNLGTAMHNFEQLGDRRRWEESMTLLGMAYYHQGQMAKAAKIREDLYATARRGNSEQTQGWAYTGQAENALLRGALDQALTFLADARAIEKSIGEIDRIWLYGVLARTHLLRGDYDSARQMAAHAVAMMQRSRPVGFYALESYAGIAEVYLALWKAVQHKKIAQPAEDFQNVAAKANRLLTQYTRIFPIGTPRTALVQGLYAWQCGQQSRALERWQAALTAADRLHMEYEQALAHSLLGRYSPPGDSRTDHAKQAENSFRRLDVTSPFASTLIELWGS